MDKTNNKILINSLEASANIIKALNSPLRRKIIDLLHHEALNINGIAQALDIPQSTCVTNVKMLENVGIIAIKRIPAKKGSQKVCSVACSEVLIQIYDVESTQADNSIETEMPIGLYTNYKVSAPCGLLSDSGVINFYDDVNSFLDPHRAQAQMIWFRDGFIEYRFPINVPARKRITAISIIAELCSEFPGHNNEWPSDITLWINGKGIGTWTSPGDMGGKKGVLTPSWWSTRDTQFGFRKIWKISSERSYIDGINSSKITLEDIDILHCDHLTVRFGIEEHANNKGGLNLFGKGFGNYEHDIILRLEVEDF